ncbi:hypothetical protein FB45DRAFT_891034 [Roridomyces roridus]|uniref:MYND-type domain-containing protein n=1 Tax=Roridomyces roridus TaxID=1738132 RepID=A0AAD7CDX0_9AGAR|nr:hypothetical protein FB45DRAFT_891034 [Roridomyces roridus]
MESLSASFQAPTATMKGDSTKERQCDNASCGQQVHLGDYKRGVVCSGCSEAQYCAPQCQEASWPSHKAACTVPASVDLKGIHLCVEKNGDDEEEEEREYRDDSNSGSEEEDEDELDMEGEGWMTAIKGVVVDIEYTHPETNATVKVGHAFLQVINIPKALTFPYGFFGCLDDNSRELALLALHFDEIGRLCPNNGCWQPEDFDLEESLVNLTVLVVDVPWRGKGIGRDVFSKLFELPELNETGLILSYPSVLNHLEPDGVNGRFGKRTAEEQAAYQAKWDRNVKFYQKSAFRRLANSDFFCLAKDTTHPSHSIPIDQDAPYQDLPPPTTEEERLQRFMAEKM